MMKKIACAASLMCIAAAANAQSSVVIYGIMDANVSYKSNAGIDGGKQWKLDSGGMNTSRFGLRGSEEISPGFKAIMQLEGGLDISSGASEGNLFGRQANVGFQGEYGKLIAGRSFSSTYDMLINFDPMGYAPQYSWVVSGSATGQLPDGMLTGESNMVKYSYDANGFAFGATYAFGEVPGSYTADAALSLAGSVTNGPFAVALTYDRANGMLDANDNYAKARSYHLAGRYDFGEIKGFVGYRNFNMSVPANIPDIRRDTYWLGAQFQLTPAYRLTAAYYYQNQKNVAAGKDADPSMFVLQTRYALSKRTDLYMVAAYSKAKNGQPIGLSRSEVAFGNSQTGLTAGVQHRF